MNRAIPAALAALALSAVVSGQAVAGGEYGPAKCFFMDRHGVRSHARRCKAALSGSAFYESGDIWLGGKHYSSARNAAENDDSADALSRARPILHNVTAEFQVRGNDDGTFCAPVKGSALLICANDVRDAGR